MSSETVANEGRQSAEGTEPEPKAGAEPKAVPESQVVMEPKGVVGSKAAARHTAPPSQWVDLGVPVHYVDHGGPSGGPTMVMVHGLGGSLVNWAALAPLLTGSCRVLALDLIGFGRTQAGASSSSVTANQRMLQGFLKEVVGGPAILVGNSMGGLISVLQATRHPESVTALVLIDPALPVTVGSQPDALISAGFGMYAMPHLGRAILRARLRVRSPEQLAMDVLGLCCVDPDRVPSDVLEQHLELARERSSYPDTDQHFLDAARSLMKMLTRRTSYMAAMKAIRVPVLLIHGEKDRLVTIGASRTVAAANPSWRFEVAPDVGHVPMLEVPGWTAGRILDWLAVDLVAQR